MLHPTNVTRRNHLSTIFYFFFSIKVYKSVNNMFFLYIFHPEGNFDIDAGDGDGDGGGGTI